MTNVILTGIKPTGQPHLGNYLGAIKPALEMAMNHQDDKKYFFIADYHALTTLKDARLMAQYRQTIAATWLSFFNGQKNCYFYFQSDIPEIFELYWILSCFCPKGMLNRAHAYKGLVAKNTENEHDPDRNINHGLYSYPVLMAADICLFHANKVPVGADQKQHVEIAGEIVKHINKQVTNKIPKPEPLIDINADIIIGTDGQKMSKNYNNTIPLFTPENELKKCVAKIQTDSIPLGSPLNADTCNVFKLASYIASDKDLFQLKENYDSGTIGYGHAKQQLTELFLTYFSDARRQYQQLMAQPQQIKQQMNQSTVAIRDIAKSNLFAIKQALGIEH